MKVLAAVAMLLLTAGCGDGRTEARLTDYSVRGPSTLVVSVDGCRLNPSVEDLQQTESEVRLLVLRDQPSGFGVSSCADIVTVEMDEPLGERPLINARSGVEVQPRTG